MSQLIPRPLCIGERSAPRLGSLIPFSRSSLGDAFITLMSFDAVLLKLDAANVCWAFLTGEIASSLDEKDANFLYSDGKIHCQLSQMHHSCCCLKGWHNHGVFGGNYLCTYCRLIWMSFFLNKEIENYIFESLMLWWWCITLKYENQE